MIVVFLGAPGTGKGTQAKMLTAEFNLIQVSTGEILRDEIKNSTELGKLANGFLERGELVPNDIIINMIQNLVEKREDQKGLIFDGFPRTLQQAEAFDNLLKKISKSVDFVLYFQTSRESLIKRLISRRMCSKCGKDYNLITNPAKNGNCDICSGEIIQRDDDKEDVIVRRMDVYENQTAPLIDYYKKENKLIVIDCEREISQIYNDIRPLFEKKAERIS